MNQKILTAAATIAIFTAVGANAVPSTVTQTSPTTNVNVSGTTFTFNSFNSALGTLNAVDLIVESSSLQGSFTINWTSGTRTFTAFNANLAITGDPGSGLSLPPYQSPQVAFSRTPSSNVTVNSGSQTATVTVNAGQSLISSPTNVGLSGGSGFSLAYYIGDGISTFGYFVENALFLTGPTTGFSLTNNLISPTQLTLQYSYTPGVAPIPEPGQVAASLLLLSGIGAYVFIKRRKKSAPAVA